MKKIQRWFFIISAIVLIVTGSAKLLSALSASEIWSVREPLLGITFRSLFYSVGALEIAVGGACLAAQNPIFKAVLIGWLSLSFILYRLALVFLDFHKPCPCLGSFTSMLNLDQGKVDIALKGVIGAMFVGSLCVIGGVCRGRARLT